MSHDAPHLSVLSYLLAVAGEYMMLRSPPEDAAGVIQHCIKWGSTLESRASSAFCRETLRYLASVDDLKDYHDYGPKQEGLPLNVLCGPVPNKWLQVGAWGRGFSGYGMPVSSMHTLGVVLYLVKFHRGSMDALRHSMWIGGDVDSIGALVLGIIGGRRGLRFSNYPPSEVEDDSDEDLPWWMLEQLEAVEHLASVSERFERVCAS